MVKSVTPPVAFAYFGAAPKPYEKVFAHIDEVLKQWDKYGLKLTIDYHYGYLNDNNYLPKRLKLMISGLL